MSELSSHRAPPEHLFRGQLPHLLLLAALVPGAWAVAAPALGDGAWRGVSDQTWFLAAIAVPVVHQVLVAVVWRLQLCYRLFTRVLGGAALTAWIAVFLPLLVARPLLAIAVGLADTGSLPIPRAVGIALGCILLVPSMWTMHSVALHFGVARAVGGDHFEERYRAMPMVRQGAFAHVSNAMYALGFLGFWAIALMCRSQAALAVALFQHAYIWVHWYTTEQPDGVLLYGQSQDA